MKKRFFSRILITYSLIICALLFLFFSVFIILMQGDSRRQMNKYLDDSFSAYVMSCENAFESIYYISQNIKSMASVDVFAFSGGKSYYEKMTLLHREMRNYASLVNSLVTTGGYGFFVHKLGDDVAVTNQKTQKLDALLAELDLDSRVYRNAAFGLDSHLQTGCSYIITDGYILYLSQKDYVDTRLVVTVYVRMEDLNLYPVDPKMQVGFFSNSSITDLRASREYPEFPAQDVRPGELAEYNANGVRYLLTPSSYLGITYYYFQEGPSAAGKTAVTVTQVGILLLLTCGAALALITAFSYRLYKPIDRLVNTLLSYEDEDMTSPAAQGDLEYIARQVVRIRRQNQELVEKLDASGSALRAELVGSILQGDYGAGQIASELERHGLSWLDEVTVPVLFDSETGRDTRITDEVAGILEGQMAEYFRCENYLDYSGRLCFLVREPGDGTLREALGQVIAVVNAAFEFRLSAFIGPRAEGVDRIRSSYIQVNRIVENRNRIGNRSIYDYSDYLRLPAEAAIYPLHNEKLLIESAARGDARETHRLLGYLFGEYVEPAFLKKESRDLIVFALLNTFNRVLQQAGLEMAQVVPEGEVVYLEMRMREDAASLRAYLYALFERVLTAIRETHRLKEQNMGEALACYITENLHRDISLLEMAEHFGLSPNYMSALFKSVMEDNFKEYLSRARFRRALEILAEAPQIRIGELACGVGVGNVNTFIRLFKKYAGVSPGQYVRQRRGDTAASDIVSYSVRKK